MVSYAPNVTARRILIVLLAFAMAVAVTFVASVAPADAAKDKKEYAAEVGTPPSSVAAIVGGPGSGTTVTFTNVSDTSTQLAGSFSVAFPSPDFTVTAASLTSSSGHAWSVLSTSGNTVVVSADSGGERLGILETVVVDVDFDAPASGSFQLTTAADQQAGGVFSGGNEFKLVGPEPTLVIPTPCVAPCELGEDNVWGALLTCTDCAFIINLAGEDIANFDVLFTGAEGTITIVMTTFKKGPAPGEAEVEVNGKILPDCGIGGEEVNCVHINRVQGNHTQYTVFWNGDPNFRFR